jgi:integrase-like protein
VLGSLPRIHPFVFTNVKTADRYTVNGAAHVFNRAVERAHIANACEVTLHTLRPTALSRTIAPGCDDYTVMEISGHSSTRMLARYTHPTEERKIGALDLPAVATKWPQNETAAEGDSSTAVEIAKLLKECGGRQEARTPDLRVANAALSQLS